MPARWPPGPVPGFDERRFSPRRLPLPRRALRKQAVASGMVLAPSPNLVDERRSGFSGGGTMRSCALSRRLPTCPDEVTFTLDEVALLLFVVDTAVECTPVASSEHTRARWAQRLLTSRLWPELGELLGDDDPEEE